MMQIVAFLISFYALKVDTLFLFICAKYLAKTLFLALFLAFNRFLPSVPL